MEFTEIKEIVGSVNDYHVKPKHPLGGIYHWKDSNGYECEAVYARNIDGSANTAGYYYCFSLSTTPSGIDLFSVETPAAATLERRAGVALSAVPDDYYGWYQRKGPHTATYVYGGGATGNLALKDPLVLVPGYNYLKRGYKSSKIVHLGSIDTAQLTNGVDVVTSFPVDFNGKIVRTFGVVEKAVQTAGLCDVNLEIGTVNLTGGVIAVLTDNTALGTVIDGAAITGNNTFKVGDTISVEVAATTAPTGTGRIGIYAVIQELEDAAPVAYCAEAYSTAAAAAKDVLLIG